MMSKNSMSGKYPYLKNGGQLGEDEAKVGLETKRENEVGLVDDKELQGAAQVQVPLPASFAACYIETKD